MSVRDTGYQIEDTPPSDDEYWTSVKGKRFIVTNKLKQLVYLKHTSVSKLYPAIRATPLLGSYKPVNTDINVVLPAP